VVVRIASRVVANASAPGLTLGADRLAAIDEALGDAIVR
jgi:hypothetical protein